MDVFERLKFTGGIDRFIERVKADPNINEQDSRGQTVLYRAVLKNRHAHIKVLLSHGANPNLVTTRGETPLHAAIRRKDHISTQVLISSGADINFVADTDTCQNYTSILSYAVNYDAAIIEMLLTRGSIVEEVFDRPCGSPLGNAIERDDVNTVSLLIEQKAPLETELQHGDTCLHLAVSKGNERIVQLLLDQGANPNAMTPNGVFPIFNICNLPYEKAFKIMELLLGAGADINASARGSENTVFYLAKEKDERLYLALLKYGPIPIDDDC